jgi:hypothetical protein
MKYIYIYISSYYQSKKNDYQLTDSEKDQIKEIITADQTLLVSYDTLDLAQKIIQNQPYHTEFSDYVTELCCDIEVAIQEKKIIKMVKQLGFNYELIPPAEGKPKIKYTEEFSINNLTLKETHDHNVYVINTHGKEQEKEALPETWMGPKNKFRDEQKHKFKQERKNYIHQLHENSLVSAAQRIIEKFNGLNIDEDFKNAVETLKQSTFFLQDLLVNRSPVAKQRAAIPAIKKSLAK